MKTLPPLSLDQWQATRDTLQGYGKVVSRIRQKQTVVMKHWWHASLFVTPLGLTTTPIDAKDGRSYTLDLNLHAHQLEIEVSDGQAATLPLTGQSVAAFRRQTLAALAPMEIEPIVEAEMFANETEGVYDKTAVSQAWQIFTQLDLQLKQFRAGFRQESGPVVLWPHHFDLAVLWFSGRLVPDQDPNDPEYSDEQMNFGFSTGDDNIPEPYFYITAYPLPNSLTNLALPARAYWHTEGFTGAILKYADLLASDDPTTTLQNYLTAVHEAGKKAMLGK